MGRKFSEIKKSMDKKKFELFCTKVALEYANSEMEYARNHFCKKYDLTSSCFYRIRDYAIENNLVDETEISKMLAKSMCNQIEHGGTGRSSRRKYNILDKNRSKEIANKMQWDIAIDLTKDYANNPDLSKYDIAVMYDVTADTVCYVLKRAIIENMVNDATFEKIRERCIKSSSKERRDYTICYFECLEKLRKQNAEES